MLRSSLPEAVVETRERNDPISPRAPRHEPPAPARKVVRGFGLGGKFGLIHLLSIS
jgi:hypothetical protein